MLDAYALLRVIMSGEPTSQEDIAHEFGVQERCARGHLKELHKLGLIHIIEWDRNYQHPIPVYKWGKGNDRERPARRSEAEKQARYRERAKLRMREYRKHLHASKHEGG